jgi:hypothetical protein
MFSMEWHNIIGVSLRILLFVMVPMTKPLWKTKAFEWIAKCQEAWEVINQSYMDAPILISLHWDLEFHVHINTFNLTTRNMLAQNPTKKCDQLITYAFQLLNHAK